MCELLERARKAQGDISYYEVAKRLGIDTALMSRWKNKKAQPNGLHTLKLAEMAGVSATEAIRLLEGGFANVSLLFMTSTALSAAYLLKSAVLSLYIM